MAAAKKASDRPKRGTVPLRSIEEIRAGINKRAEREIVISGKQLKGKVIKRVTSGCISYDIALGGGLPLNSWIEIIGPPSAGKTSFILQTIAANQALDPNYFVVWGASESFNVAWAEAAGCDIDRFEFIETNIMEEMYAGIIDYLEDRACDCLVLDSYPALTPLDEDEADIGESRPGLGARTTNKFYRKQAPASRRSLTEEDRDCLLIIVNQWRSKIGVIFGDPRITPGGQGKDYACAIRAEFARDEWIKEGTGTDTVRVGITMRLHTIKNKTAPNERVAGVDFYFAPNALAVPPGCYDVAKDLYTAGVYYDIIEKAERGGGHTFLDQSWTSLAKMMASLREDLDLQAQLRYEILRSQGLDVEPPAKHRPAKRAAPRTRAPAKKSAPVVHMTKKR